MAEDKSRLCDPGRRTKEKLALSTFSGLLCGGGGILAAWMRLLCYLPGILRVMQQFGAARYSKVVDMGQR